MSRPGTIWEVNKRSEKRLSPQAAQASIVIGWKWAPLGKTIWLIYHMPVFLVYKRKRVHASSFAHELSDTGIPCFGLSRQRPSDGNHLNMPPPKYSESSCIFEFEIISDGKQRGYDKRDMWYVMRDLQDMTTHLYSSILGEVGLQIRESMG